MRGLAFLMLTVFVLAMIPADARPHTSMRPPPAGSSEADKAELGRHIKTVGDTVIAIISDRSVSLTQRQNRLRQILNKNFNIRVIARSVITRQKKAATPDQLERFFDLFRDYLLVRYAILFDRYRDERFLVDDTREIRRGTFVVSSRIIPPRGEAILVDWFLRPDRDKTMKIVEVRIENISQTRSLRDEFAAIIDRDGFEGLLRSMQTLVDRLSSD